MMKRPPIFMHDFLIPEGRDLNDPAVVTPDGGSMTFGDVLGLAEELKGRLSATGVVAGDRVLLRSAPTPVALGAIIACSQLHAVLVPVDPEAPSARINQIIELAEPAAMVDQCETGAGDGGAPGGLLVRALPQPTRRRLATPLDTDLAYIIFTSGTTGTPKGICMSHGALVAFWDGMVDCVPLRAGSILGTTSPLHFDMSLLDLGLAWGSGAPVAQLNRRNLMSPRHFVAAMQSAGVTQLNCVPSVWRILIRHAGAELSGLTDLRSTMFAGEPFPTGDVRLLRELIPGLSLINCFGQSESVACSFLEVPADITGLPSLPIGPAHRGAELLLLDDDGVAVGKGQVGELFLRGRTLFSGYWRNPEATGRALVPHPGREEDPQRVFRTGDLAELGEDGYYYFVGRRDHQVKIRGNRVELEEIERCLERHPEVVEAGVYLATDDADREQLTAVVAAVAGTWSAQRDAIVALCESELPDYMVPTAVHRVEHLPRNHAGKLDRLTLPVADRLAKVGDHAD